MASPAVELRACWQFPATWKLLQLLSTPLSFNVPSPSILEQAFLSPEEHRTLIANLHGRLLGLSAGQSAAKKWLITAARFVGQRQDDFHHILSSQTETTVNSNPDIKEEMIKEEFVEIIPTVPNVVLPRKEEEYEALPPVTRLLVLHTIAELVLANHDSLLSAGSLADIPLENLRVYPFASDAIGNDYFYFGDAERIYREPKRKEPKGRPQNAKEQAKAAAKAAQLASAHAEKLAKQEKRREAREKKEEAKRRREEKKRKAMEKWAPRVAATRTTRASRRAKLSSSQTDAHQSVSVEIEERNEDTGNGTMEAPSQKSDDVEASTSNGLVTGISNSDIPEGSSKRTSGRRRKSSLKAEESAAAAKPRKRPRSAEDFDDPTLRKCKRWELVSSGSDALRDVIQRFQPDMVTVLPQEKVLVRTMEEHVLPEIVEQEALLRKERERAERKRRVELQVTYSKRSSRVQALEQKREEAARRQAEEEERERELEQRKLDHIAEVETQVGNLEMLQAHELRSMRLSHGRTDVINRDDLLRKAKERKAAREMRTEATSVRRSARTHRTSRRASNNMEESTSPYTRTRTRRSSRNKPSVNYDPPTPVLSDEDFDPEGMESEEDKTDAMETERDLMHSGGEETTSKHSTPNDQANQSTHHDPGNGSGDEKSKENCVDGDGSVRSTAIREELVKPEFTWMINPDDGEPIRVLDKFFFALKPNFEDAPLELLDEEGSDIVGFGVLVPPFGSNMEAIRIEIPKVSEWVVEYGGEPKIWTKTESAWYELRGPAVEYQTAFASARRKFEMCVRIQILGTTYRTADLTYASIVELLGFRYNEMQSFEEEQIVAEKRFILAQVESLGIKALLQSGFIRELRKKVKSEDAARLRADMRNSAKTTTAESLLRAKKPGQNKTEGSAKRSSAKLSGAGKPVPRAVASILSGVLRAAMRNTSRKRKQDKSQKDLVPGGTTSQPTKKMKLSMVKDHREPLKFPTRSKDNPQKDNNQTANIADRDAPVLSNGKPAVLEKTSDGSGKANITNGCIPVVSDRDVNGDANGLKEEKTDNQEVVRGGAAGKKMSDSPSEKVVSEVGDVQNKNENDSGAVKVLERASNEDYNVHGSIAENKISASADEKNVSESKDVNNKETFQRDTLSLPANGHSETRPTKVCVGLGESTASASENPEGPPWSAKSVMEIDTPVKDVNSKERPPQTFEGNGLLQNAAVGDEAPKTSQVREN